MSELLDLLQAGDVDGFNAARGDTRLELFAEELAELSLSGAQLSHVVLDKSDLTSTDLTEAHLVGTSMNDIDGTGLVLDGVIALGARLRDAWMEEADLTGADLSRADLSGAVLHRTKGEGVRLLHAKLHGAEADGATWPLADFTEARLKGAALKGCDLSRSRWVEAQAGDCDLSGSDLTGADAATVSMPGATLVGTLFRAARMPGAQLPNATLTQADLRDADLTGANLSGADLSGANLRGAILIDATLDGATLTGADLEGADLTGVDVTALGLDEAQVASLARHGAVFDVEAALTYDDVAVAQAGGVFVAAWRNEEDDGSTMRWARVAKGEAIEGGVLAVRGERVLHHAVAPVGDEVQIHVLTERPDGATMLVWRVGATGPARGPVATTLGYDPAVRPLLQVADGTVRVIGLARRGPTLVVHEGTSVDGPMAALGGRPMNTARGFVGRTHPVLLGKGGVVQQLDGTTPRKPVGVPEGFPGPVCDAVPIDSGRQDRVPASARASEILVVWAAPAKLRDPGGVRAQRLGIDEEPERVGLVPDVLDLEVTPVGDGAWVAWIEQDGPEERAVCAASIPGGQVQDVASGTEPWTTVKLLPGAEPRVMLRSLLGKVEVRDLKGTVLVAFGQRVKFSA